MKKLAILGSTGSIGVSTLDIVASAPDRFKVEALTGGKNIELLAEQIKAFSPKVVSVLDKEDAAQLAGMLPSANRPEIFSGVEGMIAAATTPDADMVVAAIVGAAGLVPTAAAIKAGKDIALANKETLVTAGRLFMDMVKKAGVKLYPVDSEHSAVFQSIEGHRKQDISKIILTASGGPFLHTLIDQLKNVTVQDALNHPNWSMGKKITIDSATMMNKGLEVIEAKWLFDTEVDKIKVNIHPQSIIHSMVEYIDGCVIAQLGTPDMKTPIAYALSYPERIPTGVKPLDLTDIGELTFLKPDMEKFPCLKLAYEAIKAGESMPAVMNAANEVAVEAFLKGILRFVQIPKLIQMVIDQHEPKEFSCVEDVLKVDLWSRKKSREVMKTL
ncbi:MAG: 1-deoxy-D-xylulose-5-phosphate reductoisomerase [Desulfuromonadales bacterium]|nr:1-deoxy-D-xylulose-5-phosphate reductoisomerase [Desulfuromonadales bacterium]